LEVISHYPILSVKKSRSRQWVPDHTEGRELRFLPTSWVLHMEYLMLELLYVEQLRWAGGGARCGIWSKTKEELEDSVLGCPIEKISGTQNKPAQSNLVLGCLTKETEDFR
jgi:hypothetical protein